MKNTLWHECRRLLCVRLDNAGDVIMTAPALAALKSAVPDRNLTLLCSSGGLAAARLIPAVDDILVYDAPWMKATGPRNSVEGDFEAIKAATGGAFDGAVIFTVYSQNPLPPALFCYLSGIPLRTAFCRENPYQLLTHWVPEAEPEGGVRHEVERQIVLAEAVGARVDDDRIVLRIPEATRRKMRALLEGLSCGDGDWLLIHPGASAPSRMYPAEQFRTTCGILAESFTLVFSGSAKEAALIEAVTSGIRGRVISLAGMTTMDELAALVREAPLLISNNTCAVHLASAAATPVVDLYARTNPQHTPWRTPNRVLSAEVPCGYCYKSVCPNGTNDCLRLIPPERVVEAVHELLEERQCIPSG